MEIANFARMPELALEAAKTWHELDPSSSHALQVVSALLVAAKRVDQAVPYLEKLLAADGVNLENGFMQLNRLLAGNPDKAANLRVVRKLAAKHSQLPQAHFAVAQASAAAGDEAAAVAAIRRAAVAAPGLGARGAARGADRAEALAGGGGQGPGRVRRRRTRTRATRA